MCMQVMSSELYITKYSASHWDINWLNQLFYSYTGIVRTSKKSNNFFSQKTPNWLVHIHTFFFSPNGHGQPIFKSDILTFISRRPQEEPQPSNVACICSTQRSTISVLPLWPTVYVLALLKCWHNVFPSNGLISCSVRWLRVLRQKLISPSRWMYNE